MSWIAGREQRETSTQREELTSISEFVGGVGKTKNGVARLAGGAVGLPDGKYGV
jgi:hypothetical protein